MSSLVFLNGQQTQISANLRGCARCSETRWLYADRPTIVLHSTDPVASFTFVHLEWRCGVECYELSRLTCVSGAISEARMWRTWRDMGCIGHGCRMCTPHAGVGFERGCFLCLSNELTCRMRTCIRYAEPVWTQSVDDLPLACYGSCCCCKHPSSSLVSPQLTRCGA